MNTMETINTLITEKQQELELETNTIDMLRLEYEVAALEVVKELLENAGHDEPDKPSTEAEEAALHELRMASIRGEWGKVKAIKAYYLHAHVGLRDAKLAVEKLADKYGL